MTLVLFVGRPQFGLRQSRPALHIWFWYSLALLALLFWSQLIRSTVLVDWLSGGVAHISDRLASLLWRPSFLHQDPGDMGGCDRRDSRPKENNRSLVSSARAPISAS